MLKKSKYKDLHIHFFLISILIFVSLTFISSSCFIPISGENLPKLEYAPHCCVLKDMSSNTLGCVKSFLTRGINETYCGYDKNGNPITDCESQAKCDDNFRSLINTKLGDTFGGVEWRSQDCSTISECNTTNCVSVIPLNDETLYPFFLTNREYMCAPENSKYINKLAQCQNGELTFVQNCGLRGGTCNQETGSCEGEIFPVNAASFVVYENSTVNKKVIMVKNLITNEIKQITNNQYTSLFPAVNGNIIAWQDQRNEDGGTYRYDIYAYDLGKDQERRITSNSYALNSPFIYDNKIIWNDYRNALYPASVGDVYMCDLTPGSTYECGTNNDRRITMFSSNNKNPQSFKDNKITWQSMYNIYMCDLTPGSTYECGIAEKLITDTGLYGDVYGNKVVYQGGANKNIIYAYDLTTSTTISLNPIPGQFNPKIYGSKVVWQDGRNGNNDIYMYDFDTSTETRITSSNCHEDSPDIYGNTVVWHKKSCTGDVNWGIRMCDLTPGSTCECGITSCEVKINTYGDYLTNPATG
ncbi:MAG: hypothetical protein PHD81_04860 [Candidatus Nanoarchaeia archaeon]|nr:hypothetical protein [Candidatus Nanoarchaeia archaeon]MDD5588408.1 hypothetical protein [Candidatus Nanoarchaeia archaeon]